MIITPGNITQSARKLLLIAFSIGLLHSTAQSQVKISGQVTDSASRPLAFVSVVLLQDSIFLAGTSTDESGKFYLSYDWKAGQSYSLKFSLIGYTSLSKSFTYTDTGFINQVILVKDNSTLAGVTVTTRKSLITRKADRYIVNVENSFLADGNTGLEVLKKSPGLWVDPNGTIRIKGTQPAIVMINDVVQKMSGDELAEYLKTLKSEDISRIEVISNPPSEYEAAGSGGIIHIILKRQKKDGLNGSVNAQYRYQGKRPFASAGTSFNYKVKNLLLSGSYTFVRDRRDIVEKAGITYPDKSFYTNYTGRAENITNHQYRLGIAYYLSANHSVDIQTVQTHNKFLQFFNSAVNHTKANQNTTGVITTDKYRLIPYGSTTLNYLWKMDTIGSTIKVIADYTYSDKTEDNNFLESYSDPNRNSLYRFSAPFVTRIYTVQSDYTKVFKGKTELKAGIKYASIKRDNIINSEKFINNEWITDTGQTNQFIYTESLLMFYSSLEKTIQKTVIKAGLRAEETFSNGNAVTISQRFKRNYFGLFPSVFIIHTFNEAKGNAVYVNYSRRLNRPSLRDLNPYRLQFNNFTALTGNPRLSPQYTHNFSVGLQLLTDYTADVYIRKTENVITLSANPGVNNSIDYISENVNSSMEYGLSLSAPFTIAKIWVNNNSFSLYHLHYTFTNQKVRQTSYSVKTVNTVIIKKIGDADMIAEYRSPYVYANLYNPRTFYLDIGFSRKILKGKGRLRLNCSDVFNTLREKELTDYNQTHILFYRKRQTRAAGISFSWNFSSGKQFDNRKIEQSNNEERGRMGN